MTAPRCVAEGERLLAGLREAAADCQAVVDVRVRGLMIGVEFAESRIARELSRENFAAEVSGGHLRDQHTITAFTLNNLAVIRYEPLLVVSDEQLDAAIEAFRAMLRTHGGFVRAELRVGADLVGRKLGFGHTTP